MEGTAKNSNSPPELVDDGQKKSTPAGSNLETVCNNHPNDFQLSYSNKEINCAILASLGQTSSVQEESSVNSN
ncbi:MAG: hypothetical protein ABIV36_24880 [Sphingobium limneticum]